MAGYISELSYAGGTISDFIEIVVPAGTDVSAYSIVKYNTAGKAIATFSLGDIVSTSGFGDVYLVDASTAGFPGLSPNQAVALVDDVGTVLQYSSFDGNVVTATEGPADGLTSAEIGTGGIGESLQSDDDGASYYVPGSPNPGTIPCYAPGTMIDTPDGPHGVETLRPGDLVSTLDHGPQPIKWVRDGTEPLNGAPDHSRPVLIQAAALGPGRPLRDLIVSPQHRILVGALGQLDWLCEDQAFAPAKALTRLPRIRVMRGNNEITWIHFACAHHEVIFANGCASESLLLGPVVLNTLSRFQRRALHRLFGPPASPDAALNGPPARPCLTVGAVRNLLCSNSDPGRAAA